VKKISLKNQYLHEEEKIVNIEKERRKGINIFMKLFLFGISLKEKEQICFCLYFVLVRDGPRGVDDKNRDWIGVNLFCF